MLCMLFIPMEIIGTNIKSGNISYGAIIAYGGGRKEMCVSFKSAQIAATYSMKTEEVFP